MDEYNVATALEDARLLLSDPGTIDPNGFLGGLDVAEALTALEEVVRQALDELEVVEDPKENEENLVNAMTAIALRSFVAGRWFGLQSEDDDSSRLHVPVPADVIAALVANAMRGGGVVGINLEVI